MDLSRATIQSLQNGLTRKEFSSRELTQVHLDRCAMLEPRLHAFLHLDPDAALRQADAADAARASGDSCGPLAGIPVAVKDVLATHDMPMTAASKILEGYCPPYDATAVARIRAAGAVMLGKTNCDEFAMGASGEHSAYGPTKNPWDVTRVPGGSSSGSAAAVAAGEAVVALGTDTGGSIRQPAGFCNVVGVKPTYGRVSRYGLLALASSLDQIGPLARTVEDAAIVFNAIAGKDDRDATSVARPSINLDVLRNGNVKGLRLGVPKEYFVEGMDPRVEERVRSVIALAREHGATIADVSLPHTAYALPVYYLILPAEASTNLARYDGIRFGNRAAGNSLREAYVRTRHDGFGQEVKRRIMLGTFALSAGYYDAYYRKAQQVRTLIRRDFDAAFRDADVLLAPTSPGLPFRLGEKAGDPLMMYLADIFTVAANIAGLPALSLPAGFVEGLPVGVQLMGPLWAEERLLTAARALERALALSLSYPAIAA